MRAFKLAGNHANIGDIELPCALWAYKAVLKIGTSFHHFILFLVGKNPLCPLIWSSVLEGAFQDT